MAKFYGKIGFAEKVEYKPGCWKSNIVTYNYSGDVIKNYSRWSESSDKVNDDLVINNQIQIIANLYAKNNFHSMKFAEYMGTRWKITGVDASTYPKLILTLGGVYNAKQT